MVVLSRTETVRDIFFASYPRPLAPSPFSGGAVSAEVEQMQKNGAVLAGKGQPEGEWRGEDEGGLCDAREQESTGRQRGYVGRVRSVRPRDRLGRELLPGGR